MSNTYVSFEDGLDPTHQRADDCVLVFVSDSCKEDNPVNEPGAMRVPVMPKTQDDILGFAAIMGWQYSYDENGSIVLHTHLIVPECDQKHDEDYCE
jgi:hypothetical protein